MMVRGGVSSSLPGWHHMMVRGGVSSSLPGWHHMMVRGGVSSSLRGWHRLMVRGGVSSSLPGWHRMMVRGGVSSSLPGWHHMLVRSGVSSLPGWHHMVRGRVQFLRGRCCEKGCTPFLDGTTRCQDRAGARQDPIHPRKAQRHLAASSARTPQPRPVPDRTPPRSASSSAKDDLLEMNCYHMDRGGGGGGGAGAGWRGFPDTWAGTRRTTAAVTDEFARVKTDVGLPS
ncbi:Endo-1,4-beta-xylanase B [Portunus trituberculatus]|uniref:Endo-1,4-beta-xylanase B n=1 Tax=Portunus trituberculatus TaxID=210409 RepID=A0A5B7D689_PORTR|nr:Endo-1,4-beta-xylanase B [Portunus trituberculatus]